MAQSRWPRNTDSAHSPGQRCSVVITPAAGHGHDRVTGHGRTGRWQPCRAAEEACSPSPSPASRRSSSRCRRALTQASDAVCAIKGMGNGFSSKARNCSRNTRTAWPRSRPTDHKWVTRICAAAVIVQTLIEIDPRYPFMDEAAQQELLRARAELEAQAPPGAVPDSLFGGCRTGRWAPGPAYSGTEDCVMLTKEQRENPAGTARRLMPGPWLLDRAPLCRAQVTLTARPP
jgi:hypothetical protein